MKRVAANAHLPTPWLFQLAKHPDDIADYWRTVVRARPIEHSLRTGPTMPINSLRGNLFGTSEFRTRDLSAPSHTLCRCATLARHSAVSGDGVTPSRVSHIWSLFQCERLRCQRSPVCYGTEASENSPLGTACCLVFWRRRYSKLRLTRLRMS